MTSPLTSIALFHLGPVPITEAVLATWAIMAVLVARRASSSTAACRVTPSPTQAVFELIVETVDSQIRDTMQRRAGALSRLHRHAVRLHLRRQLVLAVPGVEPPTAHLETDAALALLVFLAVIWFGVRAGGMRGYLAHLRVAQRRS